MCNSSTNVFSNTRGWEQHELTRTDEKGKKRGLSMERCKTCTKKRPDGPSLPNQNTIIMNIIC